MYVTIKPKFQKEISYEVNRKILLSQEETESMEFRAILCPFCDQHIVDVFEDIIGHFAVKCQKCKAVIPINAAYFKSSEYVARLKRAQLLGLIPNNKN